MIVELSAEERRRIDEAVDQIQARVRDAGIINHTRRDPEMSQRQTDCTGLTGEYAVAKTFGLGIEACGILLKGTCMDGGHDIALPAGITVQVKTVAVHTNPNRPYWFALEDTNLDKFTADVGVLALWLIKDPSKVVLTGYVTRERFHKEYQLTDLGTGKRAAMASCLFNPIEELINDCRGCP